jgi:hypothetical protein
MKGKETLLLNIIERTTSGAPKMMGKRREKKFCEALRAHISYVRNTASPDLGDIARRSYIPHLVSYCLVTSPENANHPLQYHSDLYECTATSPTRCVYHVLRAPYGISLCRVK